MDTVRTIDIVNEKKPNLIWHKFMVYFFLWVSAFLSFRSGLECLTGSALGENRNAVYEMFPAIHYLYAVFGVTAIIVALFTVYACIELIMYKKDGPKDLYISFSAQIISSLIFEIGSCIIIGIENINLAQPALSLLIQTVLLVVNIMYYKKNKEYFKK